MDEMPISMRVDSNEVNFEGGNIKEDNTESCGNKTKSSYRKSPKK